MRQQFYVTYWRSQFSGQVSAIGARDEAIFTKNKTLLIYKIEKTMRPRVLTMDYIILIKNTRIKELNE